MNRRDRRANRAEKRRIAKKRKLKPDAVLQIQRAMVKLRARVDDLRSNLPEVMEFDDVCGWRFALSWLDATHSYMLSAQVKPIDRELTDRDGHHLGVALEAVQHVGEPAPVPYSPPDAPPTAVHRFMWKAVSPRSASLAQPQPAQHGTDDEAGDALALDGGLG